MVLDRAPEGRGDVGTYLLSEFPFGGGPALKTALIERPVDRYGDLYSGPRWSPDGSSLVVTRVNGFSVPQLAFVDRDGHLTGPVIDDADRPDWSSTGRIVYQSAGEAIAVPDLFVGKPSGPFRRLVRNGNSASWSPDGRRIAFVRKGGIYIVPARGGSARRIVKPGPWVENFGGGRVRSHGSALPVWSPDGRQVAFVRSGHGGEVRRLYAVNLKTRRVRRISEQRIDDDQIDSLDWRALPGDQGG
jgi:Tol biopolymer transport system component